jgi:hypothetical protein
MPHRHCERSEAIHLSPRGKMDCFVAFAPRNDGSYLSPLAGRGKIASPDAIRVRGYRSIDRAPWPREPLTPTLSPRRAGRGGADPPGASQKGHSSCPFFGIAAIGLSRLERPGAGASATNRQRFWPRILPSKGLAMLIRSENCGILGGAADAVRVPAISAASLPTLLIGGLLLLIGP